MNGQAQARPLPPMGLVTLLATVAMLFTAFTASYLIRRTSADWRPVPLPSVLWLNTLILAASSATLEAARRTGRGSWLTATLLLGMGFLAGQIVAWHQLTSADIHLPTGPHGAFLYMLSGVHGLHILGGLAALAAALRRPAWMGAGAAFWHFMGGVWVWVLILLAAM